MHPAAAQAAPPAESATAHGEADPDDRPEPGRVQRSLMGAFVALVFAANLMLHFPDSATGDELRPVGTTILDALGIEMTWVVFAPNPPDHSIELVAEITYEDGSTTTWRPPRTEPWIGTYHQYRWGKLAEFTIRGGDAYAWSKGQLAAALVQRFERGSDVPVASVELIARSKPIPGVGDPVWTDEVLVRHVPEETP